MLSMDQSPVMTLLRLLSFAACAALAACAGSPEPLACADADWFELGQRDGLVGASKGEFKSREDRCEDADAPVRSDLYEEGYAAGLAAYCTAEGGFQAGRDELKYEDACAPPQEAAFLAAFEIGRDLRRLEVAAADAREDHEKALRDLDRHRFSLRIARNRVNDSYAAGPDVAAARADVDYHAGEVRRLDGAAPKLRARLEEADAALAAFKAELEGSRFRSLAE